MCAPTNWNPTLIFTALFPIANRIGHVYDSKKWISFKSVMIFQHFNFYLKRSLHLRKITMILKALCINVTYYMTNDYNNNNYRYVYNTEDAERHFQNSLSRCTRTCPNVLYIRINLHLFIQFVALSLRILFKWHLCHKVSSEIAKNSGNKVQHNTCFRMSRCTSFVRCYILSRAYPDTIFVQTINNQNASVSFFTAVWRIKFIICPYVV